MWLLAVFAFLHLYLAGNASKVGHLLPSFPNISGTAQVSMLADMNLSANHMTHHDALACCGGRRDLQSAKLSQFIQPRNLHFLKLLLRQNPN